MDILMKGAPCSKESSEKLAGRADELKRSGIFPKLAIIRVGEREDDLAYERGALKRMEKCHIDTEVYALKADVSQEVFEDRLQTLNMDRSVHGILIFRPLPPQLDEKRIAALINPAKDVDGMSPVNIARLLSRDRSGFAPCTPEAVIKLLRYYNVDLEGKNVTLIGRSLVVGKPLALLLISGNATVTICHTKTRDLAEKTRNSDIIIAAAGQAKMLTADMVSPGTIVVDVGINVDPEGNLCGDVDFDGVSEKASMISPVPGGVGSLTTTVLAEHVLQNL